MLLGTHCSCTWAPSAPVRARLGSVVNLPLSSLGFPCACCLQPVCVAEVGWPRHSDEAVEAAARLQRQRNPDNSFVGNGQHHHVTPTATPLLFLALHGTHHATTPTADYVSNSSQSDMCVSCRLGFTRPTNTSAVGRAASREVRVGPAAVWVRRPLRSCPWSSAVEVGLAWALPCSAIPSWVALLCSTPSQPGGAPHPITGMSPTRPSWPGSSSWRLLYLVLVLVDLIVVVVGCLLLCCTTGMVCVDGLFSVA